MRLAEGLTVCDRGKWCDIITHNCFLTGILTGPRDPRFVSRLRVWLQCRSILDPWRLHVGTFQIVSCLRVWIVTWSCIFYFMLVLWVSGQLADTPEISYLLAASHHPTTFIPLRPQLFKIFFYMNCTHLLSDQTVLVLNGSELPQHKSKKRPLL